ncbi:MAG: apolipoprotein N-acyltransferase [Desulfurella sp.]|uniref:apolipoprotein N-acyltransferase n=1 Tax=Desulfurella sp. TaxID=1962857 RepID=UPI003D13F6EE
MWSKNNIERFAFILAPFLLILSFYYSFISFFAFVPLLISLNSQKSAKVFLDVFLIISISFLPFFLFLYIGLLKGIYVYNHVPFFLAFSMYFGVCIYQLAYTIVPFYLIKKFNISFLLLPVFYIAFEYLRSIVLYGDPIGNVSIFVYNMPFFIKDATWFGSYFVGLKLLFVNVAIYYLYKNKIKYAFIILGSIACLFFVVNFPTKNGSMKKSIALIQGNISQSQKWDNAMLINNLNVYVNATKKTNADLVVWPESAYPFLFKPQDFDNLLGYYKTPIIFGAQTQRGNNYYNSAVFFNNRKYDYYDKHKLVPFAEFIPLRKYLSFIPTVTKFGSFTHGKRFTLFDVDGLKTAAIICYEEDFENIARTFKNLGARLLVVITNDAWFGNTPTFHLFYRDDFYRAVENNIYVARCANTGFSMIVSPQGKMITNLKPYTFGILKADIVFDDKKITIFDKFGHFFGLFDLIFTGILLSIAIIKKKKAA